MRVGQCATNYFGITHISHICSAGGGKIKGEQKIKIIGSLFETYLKNVDKEDNKGAVVISLWMKKMFLNPNDVNNTGEQSSRAYRHCFMEAWKKFDKIRHMDNGRDIVSRFENEIVEILKPNEPEN